MKALKICLNPSSSPYRFTNRGGLSSMRPSLVY